MKRLLNWLCLAAASLFAAGALAQAPSPDGRYGTREPLSQAELDQILAPIALYPDSLLSQILMATTYPRDLAEAASWSRVNSGIRGDSAVRAVEDRQWDPSVVSLVAFPEVLAMLDERRDWADRLAEAYMEQHEQVMDTIQDLRRRADEAGSLRSSEELVVQKEGGHYVIEPPTPEIVYVPYYDPRYAYGDWWWPAYEPIWWRPWAGYHYRHGYRGFFWGPHISVGRHFFFGHIDWRYRHIRFGSHRPWYFRGDHFRQGHRWVRDHRRGDHRWWRDGDRSRWRDGDRNRWRDGDRDRREWRDRRDGRGDDRDRREWRDRRDGRDGRRGDRRSDVNTPQTSSGFFQERALTPRDRDAIPRFPAVAPGTATYRADPDAGDRRRAPVLRQPAAPEVQQRAPMPTQRAAPVVRQAPVREAPAVRQAPVREAPVVRQAPEARNPVERAPRAAAPARREAPQRQERSEPSERSPGSNGMGRGGGGDRR